LGLKEETESLVRKSLPKETGMLIVDQVIPQGPAHTILNTGDILVNVNKNLVTTFLELEDILDASVGQEITLGII
jgi:S1-C subfamily serine protease